MLMFERRLEAVLATWAVYHFLISVIKLSQRLDSPWYVMLSYKLKMWSIGKLLAGNGDVNKV